MNLSSDFKKLLILVFAIALVMPALYAQNNKKLSLGEQELFKASKNNSAGTVDGKMDEVSWKKTEVRTLDYFTI